MEPPAPQPDSVPISGIILPGGSITMALTLDIGLLPFLAVEGFSKHIPNK